MKSYIAWICDISPWGIRGPSQIDKMTDVCELSQKYIIKEGGFRNSGKRGVDLW